MPAPDKTSPFFYVNAICEKTPVEEGEVRRFYSPYLTNHSLSNQMDCVLLANQMNLTPNLPPLTQFDFLWGTVRKGKRFGKWHKPQEQPHLELVMTYFGYSKQKALEALKVLTQSDLKRMMEEMDKGGS